jgi:hypothetical protein
MKKNNKKLYGYLNGVGKVSPEMIQKYIQNQG